MPLASVAGFHVTTRIPSSSKYGFGSGKKLTFSGLLGYLRSTVAFNGEFAFPSSPFKPAKSVVLKKYSITQPSRNDNETVLLQT